MSLKTSMVEKLEAHTTVIPETSCVVWVGCCNQKGYGRLQHHGKLFAAHRVAYEIKHGPVPIGMVIDHLCHVPACVNPDHMRVCTNNGNAKNRKLNANNKSGFKGVYRNGYKGKKGLPARWVATIQSDGKTISLGSFSTKEEAHEAYRSAAVELHGEFANFGGV